jgi:hypothetical protein
MGIDTLLNDEGKGVLTAELNRVFIANGCNPACHICGNKIAIGDKLHLKPFFAKTAQFDEDSKFDPPYVDSKGTTTHSIDVMICMKCSDSNRRLPEGEMDQLLNVAHEHGMAVTNPEPDDAFGKIKLRSESTHYSTSTPGRARRFGGAVIVRTPAGITIVGSGT